MRIVGMLGVWTAMIIIGWSADPQVALPIAGTTRSVQFNEASFDIGNFGKLTQIAARKKSEDSLQAHLRLIEEAAELTEAQRSELDLAGRIDIHRFFADYERLKRSMRFGPLDRDQWQRQYIETQRAIVSIRDHYNRGLHGESSLFGKTVAGTLDTDQRARIDQAFRQRARAAYTNHIRITLAMIDHRVPLTQQQRSTITTVLLSKTDPPESYGSPTTPYVTVLNQMAQVEDEIRELFSDQEWDAISRLILFGKNAVNKP